MPRSPLAIAFCAALALTLLIGWFMPHGWIAMFIVPPVAAAVGVRWPKRKR